MELTMTNSKDENEFVYETFADMSSDIEDIIKKNMEKFNIQQIYTAMLAIIGTSIFTSAPNMEEAKKLINESILHGLKISNEFKRMESKDETV